MPTVSDHKNMNTPASFLTPFYVSSFWPSGLNPSTSLICRTHERDGDWCLDSASTSLRFLVHCSEIVPQKNALNCSQWQLITVLVFVVLSHCPAWLFHILTFLRVVRGQMLSVWEHANVSVCVCMVCMFLSLFLKWRLLIDTMKSIILLVFVLIFNGITHSNTNLLVISIFWKDYLCLLCHRMLLCFIAK